MTFRLVSLALLAVAIAAAALHYPTIVETTAAAWVKGRLAGQCAAAVVGHGDARVGPTTDLTAYCTLRARAAELRAKRSAGENPFRRFIEPGEDA